MWRDYDKKAKNSVSGPYTGKSFSTLGPSDAKQWPYRTLKSVFSYTIFRYKQLLLVRHLAGVELSPPKGQKGVWGPFLAEIAQ